MNVDETVVPDALLLRVRHRLHEGLDEERRNPEAHRMRYVPSAADRRRWSQ